MDHFLLILKIFSDFVGKKNGVWISPLADRFVFN